jgi:hypothetical protein
MLRPPCLNGLIPLGSIACTRPGGNRLGGCKSAEHPQKARTAEGVLRPFGSGSSGLGEARREIARSVAWELGEDPPAQGDELAILAYLQLKAPPVYDPFSGGGSTPLEAQRLGLRAQGSDLNPVAVLIGKAMVEIPPKVRWPTKEPRGARGGKQWPFAGLGRCAGAGFRCTLLWCLDTQ